MKIRQQCLQEKNFILAGVSSYTVDKTTQNLNWKKKSYFHLKIWFHLKVQLVLLLVFK